MVAHAERGDVVVADAADYLRSLSAGIGAPIVSTSFPDEPVGMTGFQTQLAAWAQSLPSAAAGLCLAAIFEAVGQGEAAVRTLDRLVRNEFFDERDTPDFRLLQLHYGRLGGSWGRFFAVPDMYGQQSNASVETIQSLLRIQDSELGFAAKTWLIPVHLWMNWGGEALRQAAWVMHGLINNDWDAPGQRSHEEIADGWICASQALILDDGEASLTIVAATAARALDHARSSGDIVRIARVVALRLLGLGRSSEDVPVLASTYDAEFSEAARVGDYFVLGFRELALGRWHVGFGGLALMQSLGTETIANRAIGHLESALAHFNKQGMDPWSMYAHIQMAKAYGDLAKANADLAKANDVLLAREAAVTCLKFASQGLGRFPILAAHLYDAHGQLQRMFGPGAEESFRTAANAAVESGLNGMAQRLASELAI